jgi:hypothetical protein
MQVAITDAKELQLVAVVTRADGTVEDLGVVAYWHSNPIKRLVWRIKQFFKGN